MKYEHKELIHDYLNLNRHINRIKYRMQKKEIEFNSQSFCGVTEFHPLGLRRNNFRVEDRVIQYIDLMTTYERNIKANKRRQQYFNQFLNGLDPHTIKSLEHRYLHAKNFEEIQELGHDEVVLDEVVEIEEAVSFEFRIDLSDEIKRKAIQVEYTSFSRDTVEDSFQAMQALLGV